jgi:hypothetical protein
MKVSLAALGSVTLIEEPMPDAGHLAVLQLVLQRMGHAEVGAKCYQVERRVPGRQRRQGDRNSQV